MLRWGDRFVTCIADKLNLSKTTVTIILAVVILLLVVFVITMVIVFHRSENAGVKIPYTSNPNGSNDRLISAQTICRHGARNPVYLLSNDPCGSIKDYWPEGLGELTNIGKQQHYELGQYFSNRYASILGNGDFVASKVYVRSTDVNRCLMSAQSCMAGLFPPRGDQVWNTKLNWQPVPIHTVPDVQDQLFYPWDECQRFHDTWDRQTTEVKSLFDKHKALLSVVETNTGDKLKSFENFTKVYDRLQVGQTKTSCTPQWANDIMKTGGVAEQIMRNFFTYRTKTTEWKKFRSGFLLKDILDRTKQYVGFQSVEPPNLVFYFAHDITISDMLTSLGLGIHMPSNPPYASCLLFELYRNKTDYYLQLFYRNTTTTLDIPALELPNGNCGTKCPLHKWYDIYKEILPTKTYDMECGNSPKGNQFSGVNYF